MGIRPGTVPPLRLRRSPGRLGRGRRTRTAWFVPLAAAAAVIAVVLGGMAAGSWLTRPASGRSGAVAAGRPAGVARSVGPSGLIPPYFVALQHPTYASVRATATGAVLDKIKTSIPYVGVAGAADDRTFVLDAQKSIVASSVTWVGQPALYLLRLRASGAKESRTRLAFPTLPAGAAVTGLALTPNGVSLAVEVNSGGRSASGRQEIIISNLATGKVRTWSATGSFDSQDPFGFTGSGVDGSESISWTADGRTLAYDWETCPDSRACGCSTREPAEAA